jgi:hypothetical protein
MATRRWLGAAKNVRQVDTITVANTWATSDDVTVTINGVDLVIVIGSLVTTAQVATTIKQAINGETLTDTAATVSPPIADGGGRALAYFREITAAISAASTSVVEITGGQTGDYDKPFTLSVTETTAGDGTATEATATAATGPHHWNNIDNWSGATVPVDNDDVVFDSGSVGCKYSLVTGIQPASVTVTNDFSGPNAYIGLPEVNEDSSSYPYAETRTKYLTFDDNSVTTTYDIGRGDGSGSRVLRISAGAGQIIWNQSGAGQRLKTGIPATLLIGTHTANVVNVNAGDLGIAFFEGEAAHVATLRIGSGVVSGAKCVCGDGVDLANASIVQNGGAAEINSATGSGTIVVGQNGTLSIKGTAAHASIDVEPGGTVYYQTNGTLGTLCRVQTGGKFIRFADLRPATITPAVQLYSGATFQDPNGVLTYSNGIKLNGCTLDDVTLDVGPNVTVTPS